MVKELDGCLVSSDKALLEKYKVRSKKDPRFLPIKNKAYKQKLIKEWLWEKIYSWDKWINAWYLPWVAYSLPPMNVRISHLDWLRDYQKSAMHAVTSFTTKWLLVVSWTGTGKSRMIHDVFNNLWWKDWCVVITSRQTISLQLQKKLWCEVYCLPTFKNKFEELNDGRILLFDEAHNTSEEVMKHLFKWKWRYIWFTATPYRWNLNLDGMEMMYGTVHDTQERTLSAKVYYIENHIRYDVATATKLCKWLSPTSPERLKRFVMASSTRNKAIVNIAVRSYADHKRVIIFLDRTKHIDFIEKKLLEHIDRKNIIVIKWLTNKEKFFESVALQQHFVIVASISCAKEWLDIPDLRVWICASNPREKGQIVQMIGRVTRFCWDKKHWIIYDFKDKTTIENSKTHYGNFNARKKIYQEEWHTVEKFISYDHVLNESH